MPDVGLPQPGWADELDNLATLSNIEIMVVEKAEAELSLYEFLKQCWSAIDPSEFIGNWHLRAIAEHLQAVNDGEIRRLIVNVPPRSGKPVWQEEWLLERRKGRVKLKEVVEGDEVLTHKGRYRRVAAVHEQGTLPLLSIACWSGRDIRVAADHPMLTARGWVNAGDLTTDDVLALVAPLEAAGGDTLTAEEARLLGYFVGDGSLMSGRVMITSASEEMSTDVEHCAATLGFYTRRVPNNGGWKSWNVVVKGNPGEGRGGYRGKGVGNKGNYGVVRHWLMKHGLWRASSYTKEVPAAVFAASDTLVAEFLGAYWACDGYFSNKGIKRDGAMRSDVVCGADSVSKELLVGVQHLLARLGIFTRIRRKVSKIVSKRQGGEYISWSMVASRQDDVAKFANVIPIRHEKRQKAAETRRSDFDRVLTADPIVAVEEAGEGVCRCLTVEEDGSFVAGDYAVKNTSLIAIAWPVWTWCQERQPGFPLRGPGVRFLCASYGAGKAQEDAVTARRLIASEWFQARWGTRVQIVKDRDNQQQYDTKAGGYRISTGIPESIGKGGAIRIIDDPHKPDEMESKVVIEAQVRAYDEVWRTRSNDPTRGAEVIVMQRLSEFDLTGHILGRGEDVVHLCLPMRYEPERHCSTVTGFSDPRTEEGQLLWPDRFDDDWAKAQQESMDSYAWHGQMQQSPTVRGGAIIGREKWQQYGPDDPIAAGLKFPEFTFTLASLDTAYTTKETSDFSALVILGTFAHQETGYQQVMLAYAWKRRLALNDLVRQVEHTCHKYKVNTLLVENKAAGHPVQQEMMRLFADRSFGIAFADPSRLGNKEERITSRAHGCSFMFDQGMVWAPRTDWAELVIDEAALFPRGRHDDLVDALSQGLHFLRDNHMLSNKQETLRQQSILETYRGRSASRPLYAA